MDALIDGLEYFVSADHVIAEYGCKDRPARISKDAYTGKYSASISGYGCSKSYSAPAVAIYAMLGDHGCTNIRIYALEVKGQ